MRINKIIFTFLLVTFSWLSCLNAYASSNHGDPVSLLQYVANGMIAGLKENEATLKSKPQIVYNLAYRYVVPNADLPLMSKRVLPPQIWNSATADQRARFEKLFTTTLIRTYASALTSYQDQTVKFYPVRGGVQGSMVEVNSDIQGSQGSPIHVTYRLVRVGGAWKLIDLSVEGVDMLESFRAQFADILSSGNMEQLLDRMSQHNTRRMD